MQSRSLSAALALVLAAAQGATSVSAQTTTGAIATAEPLPLAAEHEAALREYVGRRPVARIVAVPGDPLRSGSVVPADIRLSPLADMSVPALNRYAYFVAPDEKIVIVDPATRQVMRVINR